MKSTAFRFSLIFILLTTAVLAQNKMAFKKEVFISEGDILNYRILYPQDFSEDKQYPLMLFLHGAGERGNDNEKQLVHGSDLFLNPKNREQFPAIVVFPQCPQEDYWSNADIDRSEAGVKFDFKKGGKPTQAMTQVMGLLDRLKTQSFVNKQRIYVGGLSMGGMGTYEILYRKPNTFAAAIAICGGANTKTVSAYAKTTPLWIFHGALDDIVNPQYSLDIAKKLLEEGAHPKMYLYDNANHNSWDYAFAEPDLLPWIFSKTLNNNKQ